MAIVSERMNAQRPPTPVNDPRRIAPNAVNAGKDLGVDPPQKEENRFFGSFFQSKKITTAAKRMSGAGTPTAEQVSFAPKPHRSRPKC